MPGPLQPSDLRVDTNCSMQDPVGPAVTTYPAANFTLKATPAPANAVSVRLPCLAASNSQSQATLCSRLHSHCMRPSALQAASSSSAEDCAPAERRLQRQAHGNPVARPGRHGHLHVRVHPAALRPEAAPLPPVRQRHPVRHLRWATAHQCSCALAGSTCHESSWESAARRPALVVPCWTGLVVALQPCSRLPQGCNAYTRCAMPAVWTTASWHCTLARVSPHGCSVSAASNLTVGFTSSNGTAIITSPVPNGATTLFPQGCVLS